MFDFYKQQLIFNPKQMPSPNLLIRLKLIEQLFNLSWYLFYSPLLSTIHDLELAKFSNLVMKLLYNSWDYNNSITLAWSNVSHPLELRKILSYLIFYNFRGKFYFYFILLDLFVLLFIVFVCSLLSTTPDSSKMGIWEGDGRGWYFLIIFWRKYL